MSVSQISRHLSDARTGRVDKESDATASKEFRLAIHALGNNHQRHPNYLSHATPQTAPMGTPRAQNTYDLEERLSFNPRPRQQAWAPPSAAQSSGVPSDKKVYTRVTDPISCTWACRYREIAITSILVLTFIVLFS
jgi:hypothetical protein